MYKQKLDWRNQLMAKVEVGKMKKHIFN